MNFKWENAFSKTLVSCVAVLGLSTQLTAAPDRCMQKDKPNFAFAYPKDLNLSNPIDLYFYVEGLAFQGMQTGLDFVLVDKNAPGATAINATVGGFGQNESWGYNFGSRIGIGAYVPHDAWNIDFDWMWLNVTDSESYEAGTGATLPTLLADNGSGTSPYLSYGSSGATWQCIFNVLDATLGKPYHISRKVIFNPHFGLRFAWIDQEYGVNYGGATIASQATPIKYKAENDFWGVGARVGMNTDWLLGYGFKIFTNLSSSILAGWFDNTIKYGTAALETVTLSSKPQVVVPNLELAAGFDWGTTLGNCGGYYLDFRAGYEFQIWWDQWNTRQFVTGVADGNFNNVPTYGNLSLNGFTFKVQLDM